MKYRKPNIPIISNEKRQEDFLNSLRLAPERVQSILQFFEEKLADGFQPQKGSEINCVQSTVTQLPSRGEAGECYALVIAEEDVWAERIRFARGEIQVVENTCGSFIHNGQKINIRQPQFTATMLLNAVVDAVGRILRNSNKRTGDCVPFVLVSVTELNISTLSSASFRFVNEFDRVDNEDSIHEMDLVQLLNIGFELRRINAKIIGVCTNATAVLLAGAYEIPKDLPVCLIGVEIGFDFGATVVQDSPKELEVGCAVVELDVSRFDGKKVGTADNNFVTKLCLPYFAVDFEVGPHVTGASPLGHMISPRFIPETCRRLILRAFQNEAPKEVWVVNSLPYNGALAILADDSSRQETIRALERCWGWNARREQVELIYGVVRATFNRSAAIVAVAMVGLAKRTGRLQPAMGGCTVSMGGLATNKFYQDLVREHLDTIFQRNTTDLIQFLGVEDGQAKGAAILSYMIQHSMP